MYMSCCLFDLACFFLPSFSHLSLKHVLNYVNVIHMQSSVHINTFLAAVRGVSSLDLPVESLDDELHATMLQILQLIM